MRFSQWIKDLPFDENQDNNTIAISSLPDDIQTLIYDYIELYGDTDPDKVSNISIPLKRIKVVKLPQFAISDDKDRGPNYASKINLNTSPPIIIAGQYWLDGRHRVSQAKASGLKYVSAIDLDQWITQKPKIFIGKIKP